MYLICIRTFTFVFPDVIYEEICLCKWLATSQILWMYMIMPVCRYANLLRNFRNNSKKVLLLCVAEMSKEREIAHLQMSFNGLSIELLHVKTTLEYPQYWNKAIA